jgi:hypothetical protein
MTRYLSDRPWIFIVAAFTLLVSIWTCFIYVAVKQGPVSFKLGEEPAAIHERR